MYASLVKSVYTDLFCGRLGVGTEHLYETFASLSAARSCASILLIFTSQIPCNQEPDCYFIILENRLKVYESILNASIGSCKHTDVRTKCE